MTRRLGFFSLRQTAHRLCRLIVKFEPIIRAAYPNNTTLQAALTAALEACSLLDAQIDAVDGTPT